MPLALLAAIGSPAGAVQAQPDSAIGGAAQTAPPADTTRDSPFQTSVEALQADAAEYAKAFGVTSAEALRRLQAQEASVPLVDDLVAGYRDRLAGVVIEHRPVYRIVIVVTGQPPGETILAVLPSGVPIVLRTGALATRAAVIDAIARHQADIRAALPAPPGMGVDPATGALLVVTQREYRDADGGEAATAARLVAIATRLGAIAGVPVEVRTWGDIDADLAVAGGARLIGSIPGDPRRFVCTSGFVVSDGATTALSTAAHCPDAMNFADRDGTTISLALIGAWGAGYQDVQLHDAGVPLRPLFHGDAADRARTVTTWRNRGSTRAGDFVCHRGQRTGYSCALVRFVDYAPAGDLCAGPCPPAWVAVEGPHCRGGDSGGPVFLGTVAFGLMKGDSAEDGVCKLYYYMSVDYLPPGWTVAHGQGAAIGDQPAARSPAAAGVTPAVPGSPRE